MLHICDLYIIIVYCNAIHFTVNGVKENEDHLSCVVKKG